MFVQVMLNGICVGSILTNHSMSDDEIFDFLDLEYSDDLVVVWEN